MSCPDEASVREYLLLTVLGKNPRPTRYVLEGREADARLAPLALLELLPEDDRPTRVLALCTPEAKRDSLPLLEAAPGVPTIELVEVPAGDTQEDISLFLDRVVGAIDTGAELTVDVTHGFRHFAFLTYIAVLYLAALRGVRIRGAYYGMLNRDSLSPFLDLRPLLELPRWLYALEVLRDTGSALPMAKNLLGGSDSRSARDSARDIRHFSEAYLSALPLEIGRQARNIREQRCKPMRKLLRDEHRLPLADKLVERLAEILEPFALTASVFGDGWKRHVRLSDDELERQAAIIDDLLARENIATALRLMREWN